MQIRVMHVIVICFALLLCFTSCRICFDEYEKMPRFSRFGLKYSRYENILRCTVLSLLWYVRTFAEDTIF